MLVQVFVVPPYNFIVTKNYARAELYIDRGDKDENEFIFG